MIVEDPEIDQIGPGGDPREVATEHVRGAAVPADDAGHVRAVTEEIVDLSAAREIYPEDDPARVRGLVDQVPEAGVDARVDDRHRYARPVIATAGEGACTRRLEGNRAGRPLLRCAQRPGHNDVGCSRLGAPSSEGVPGITVAAEGVPSLHLLPADSQRTGVAIGGHGIDDDLARRARDLHPRGAAGPRRRGEESVRRGLIDVEEGDGSRHDPFRCRQRDDDIGAAGGGSEQPPHFRAILIPVRILGADASERDPPVGDAGHRSVPVAERHTDDEDAVRPGPDRVRPGQGPAFVGWPSHAARLVDDDRRRDAGPLVTFRG